MRRSPICQARPGAITRGRAATAGLVLLVATVGTGLASGSAVAAPGDVVFVETSAQQVNVPLTNGTFALDSAVADVDGDGNLDLLNVRHASGLGIQFGRGDGTFEPVVVRPYAQQHIRVAVADLDEDGDDDVVTTSIDMNVPAVAVYHGDPTRALTPPVVTLMTPAPDDGFPGMSMRPSSVAVADLDLDGHQDVVAANGTDTYVVLAGDGTGSLTEAVTNVPVATYMNPSAPMTVADLNADGHPDLVTAFRDSVSVTLATGTGGFAFHPPAFRSIDGRGFESLNHHLVDLDHDGDRDLVFGSKSNNFANPAWGLFVLRGNGDGTFAPAAEELAPGSFTGAVAADLNDDGLRDLASVDSGTGELVAYLAAAAGTYVPSPVTYPIGDTHQVLAADFDGDGIADLQSTSYRDYVSHVLTNQLLNQAPAVTTHPQAIVVASGEAATLTARASGTPPPSVQWERSTDGGTTWTPVAGATAQTFTTPAADASTTGYAYRAVFTNSAGTATSDPATVDAVEVPVVTTEPQAQTAGVGDDVTFTAAATGDALTVRWQVSTDGGTTFTDLPGETTTTLVVTATEELDGNAYRAVFTTLGGETASAGAVLTVSSAAVGVVPSAPRDVRATQTGPGQITITWTAPADPGSSPVTSYDAGYATPRWGNGGPVPASTFSAMFDDIEPGDYTASVAAVNAEGSGPRVFVPVTVAPYPATPPPGVSVGVPTHPGAGTPAGAVADDGAVAVRAEWADRDGRTVSALADTGVDVREGLSFGGLSLMLGLLLVVVARRRRPGPTVAA